ncbi:Sedlin [Rozella allomycis CSF55]|uniref:Sedlin n=1 Tax=Rozella allomycis (strain CSF55) TaxID=988480 RepID=A0A075AP13_ROZAC|nr:Sedlin domain-containing protein [Rozella allomycis CSF55]RKP19701.1 Sedlin [Rozella allomycis CSF55]|eukprot:EPZ31664.1 Sedlin domain-containing protein [Rozella allomycis CSF55]
MATNYYLVIVDANDHPVYEAEYGPLSRGEVKKEDWRQLIQFIAYSSLDVIDESIMNSNGFYFKVIDKFNEWFVSAHITPSGMRMVVLHDARNEDAIKNFLFDCHELYSRMLLSPFFDPNSSIQSVHFDSKVKALMKKYFQI